MLVGLFQKNLDVFVSNNVNCLKVGVILGILVKVVVEVIFDVEVKRIYVIQVVDWNIYCQKLVVVMVKGFVKEEFISQLSFGKVIVKVEEKIVLVEQGKDCVKVLFIELVVINVVFSKFVVESEVDKIVKNWVFQEV